MSSAPGTCRDTPRPKPRSCASPAKTAHQCAAVSAVAAGVPVPVASVDRREREAGRRHGIGVAEVERRVRVAAVPVQHHDQAPRRPPFRYGQPPAGLAKAVGVVEDAFTAGRPRGRRAACGERAAERRARAEPQRGPEHSAPRQLARAVHAGSIWGPYAVGTSGGTAKVPVPVVGLRPGCLRATGGVPYI